MNHHAPQTSLSSSTFKCHCMTLLYDARLSFCLCASVCLSVCLCIFMYICTSAFMAVCMDVSMSLSLLECLCECVLVCLCMAKYLYVWRGGRLLRAVGL